ncbi:hypothetical protein ACLOJK_039361 [Asimina triloba]
MANYLAQFQTIKSACDHLIIAVEDVSDLWPLVKEGFEERLPFKKASLNNKTRNPVTVEKLPAEFILTTDARLRSRFPQEQSLFWFREPYATVVLVTCEDLDEFKTILKPRLKLIVQNDDREWFIVFVSKASPSNDQAVKQAKKVYAKVEVEFSSKKRERCCKLDLHGADTSFWEDLESKIVESIRNTLDKRVQFYEDEIRKLSEQRLMPVWNFCNFFILKESLAFMFEMAHLHEDALREYDELELCYLETVNASNIRQKDFGGLDHGDDQAAFLNPGYKPLSQIVQDDSFREFEFRQYLFAYQAKKGAYYYLKGGKKDKGKIKCALKKFDTIEFDLMLIYVMVNCSLRCAQLGIPDLLFKLYRPVEVASRGYSFVISFSKTLAQHENALPFCMREVWIITACLALINSTSSHDVGGIVAPDIEKEFHRLQGDLYSLCRVKGCNDAPWTLKQLKASPPQPQIPNEILLKLGFDGFAPVTAEEFMRLGYLIGYGVEMERSPVNRYNSVFILQTNPRAKHFSIQRKPLPLEPCLLLREANRRRASLSAGNTFETFDGPGSDGFPRGSPSNKVQAAAMSRINSGPGSLESSSLSLDRPMRLSEIYVAAEHALQSTISNPDLWKSLSIQEFEQKYLELTKGAADNYHHSWWKRHGVVLDGEIAAVCHKHGNYDLAAKSYEKVCALYAGEGWQELLAEVLPNLAECQKILNDEAGYLASCVRLLALDKWLFLTKERQAFQSEVVCLAHSEMKHPVPLDVSALITFSGNPGPPLELYDKDPGTLSVTVWSGFPDDITLESLSLTLIATYGADEGVKPVRSSPATVLRPGWNTITLSLPPQNPGSYILGVLTGQIGHLRFRSHSFSKGGPPDSDDFMNYEKPTRPVLKVFKPRPLVDITAAVSSALLMNEPQWVGFIVNPINYSLKGAILHIDTGPELLIESHLVEIESYTNASQRLGPVGYSDDERNVQPPASKEFRQLELKDGKVELPDWASNISSVLWFPVRAIDKRLARGTSAVTPARQSVVDGMRTIAVKLEFGVSHNQTFERTVAVHFTDPFHVSTRISDKCSDGTLLLQVILHSQVKATLTVYDAWLDLQAGFIHIGKDVGKPTSSFFPLVISPSSRAGILFGICLGSLNGGDEDEALQRDSILNIKYGISGDRSVGAHSPASSAYEVVSGKELLFKSALVLERPVLDPCLAVGFLPLPSVDLRVGQLVTIRWRVERLRDLKRDTTSTDDDEVLYDIKANPNNWMIAGRKRGHVLLSKKQAKQQEVRFENHLDSGPAGTDTPARIQSRKILVTMDALRKQASKLKEQVAKQQQAVKKQFIVSGYESSEVMVIDEVELERHHQLEKLYRSTRAAKDLQKEIVRAAEGFTNIGLKEIEIGGELSADKSLCQSGAKLSEDCIKYGTENFSVGILAKAASLYGDSRVHVEKEREEFNKMLSSQVLEPLRSMISGAPLEDARHLAQRYSRMRQEAETQASEVSRRQARARELANAENTVKLQASESKMQELRANMAVLGKEAGSALAAVESQQQRLTFQRLVALVEAEKVYHQRVAEILDGIQAEMISDKQRKDSAIPEPPVISHSESRSEKAMYFLAEAMHAFDGASEKELSLAVGDYVVVRQSTPSGWSEGECSGRAGWFPSAFVEKREQIPASGVATKVF